MDKEHAFTICCGNFICFVLFWITYIVMMFQFSESILELELPKLDGLDYENKIPLISSIYKAEAVTQKPMPSWVVQDKYKCGKDDDFRIKMVWPGTVTICYAEQGDFYDKRENPLV